MPVRAYILATLASIVMVGFSTLVRLPGMIVRRKDQLACEGTWWNQLHISELVEAGHGWARSSVAVVEGVVSPDETGQYDFVLRVRSLFLLELKYSWFEAFWLLLKAQLSSGDATVAGLSIRSTIFACRHTSTTLRRAHPSPTDTSPVLPCYFVFWSLPFPSGW